ncbi:hypothetical protein NDN08_006113 [Rhodosorus marinus]|uniref:Uncharacterized protein n=1 Tax=Rhodosorus marinus TaxID=101924 RepID=A0AAV8UJS8_9RHOD|nr:hypothetical protein NDN08_006113 [Rhodosorus marinus]
MQAGNLVNHPPRFSGNPDDFPIFDTKFRCFVLGLDLWGFFDGSEKLPEEVEPAEEWEARRAFAAAWLLQGLTAEALRLVSGLDDPKAIRDLLCQTYAPRTVHALLKLEAELFSRKLKPGESVPSVVEWFERKFYNFEYICETPFPEVFKVGLLYNSLRDNPQVNVAHALICSSSLDNLVWDSVANRILQQYK